MKTTTKKLTIIAILLFSFVASQQLKAQGNVISVTTNSGELGSTVTLTISGSNTMFSQVTTSLHKTATIQKTIWASNMNVLNDSLMQATFIIPGNINYVGLYDVMGGFANPLVNGFNITAGVTIHGNVFYDVNGNCLKDGGELSIPYHALQVQPGNTIIPVSASGDYTAYVPTGFYTATIGLVGTSSQESIHCFSSGIDSITIATAVPSTMNNQNIATAWTDSCSQIQTTIYTHHRKPCFHNYTYITALNLSPMADTNAVITLALDNNFIPISSNPVWSSYIGNVLTFNLGTIQGFGSRTIFVNDSISCNATIGTTFCLSDMSVQSNLACVDSSINFSQTCMPFTSSYDPNEKVTVSPSTTNLTSTDELTYSIGFQNTGTDTATNVVILDTLSNYLNAYTLIPQPSNHTYTYQLIGSNIAKFTFNNINLPDSTTDQINSHGFITYTIQQNPNNQPGTQILNTGNIYFDFNSNIRTNTTYNQIPMLSVGMTENVIKDGITIYPNPFSNTTKFVFTNKTQNSKYTIQLFDITGKKVREINNITDNYFDLNRGDLKAQLYFYKVFDNQNQVSTGKLVIMD